MNPGVSTTVTTLAWTGPFRISDLLAACMDDDHAWPPASKGVYLVSRDDWQDSPSSACHPLYVGGNTGDSQRFCTRIGDLIADLHGLWDGGTGHHSGGQSLLLLVSDEQGPSRQPLHRLGYAHTVVRSVRGGPTRELARHLVGGARNAAQQVEAASLSHPR